MTAEAAARPRGGNGAATADRLALAAALALLLALALYGSRVHWVEEAGTAERDGYVGQAELLRSGSLPRDPYRPLLYPLLTAALSPLTGGPFAAARLLSNLAAAGLAWLAYAYGRRLAGAAAGGWAMALAAVNPNLWIIGQHVTTDMLFAALAAASLLAGLRYLQAPAAAPALAAGLALGLAAFTRSNALFLVPALAAAWLLAAPEEPAREPADVEPAAREPAALEPAAREPASGPQRGGPGRRLGHLAMAAAAAVVVLLPHWALRHAQFGNPFYDENWKNLALKLYGWPDWSYLDRVPFRSLAAVVAHDPAAVLRGGLAELRRFATAGAAQLLGTWAHVVLFGAAALWAVAPRGARALQRPRRTRRSAAWLLFALGTFLVATAFAFFTWGRLLLLLLPGAYALGFAPWGGAPDGRDDAGVDLFGGRRRLLVLAAIGAAAVLLLAVKTFAYRLPAFAARHPYVEVETLQRLDAELPAGAALGGSSPFLGRYLRHRYVALPDALGPETARPDLYYAKLRPLLRREGVAYLVIGTVDLRSRPPQLLGPRAPVSWLAPAGAERGVAVWRVTPG
ncbi:MAG TPA: glycosyltransferase family 39 protein [Thermoanaerobaculia bacterium]|nr:glycosyltransferase family 39 protein [Thermoanaerobaculia bacterium]